MMRFRENGNLEKWELEKWFRENGRQENDFRETGGSAVQLMKMNFTIRI